MELMQVGPVIKYGSNAAPQAGRGGAEAGRLPPGSGRPEPHGCGARALVKHDDPDYRLRPLFSARAEWVRSTAACTRAGSRGGRQGALARGSGATFVQRFLERGQAPRLAPPSPTSVELYDFIEHRGQLCIVMGVRGRRNSLRGCACREPLRSTRPIAVFAGVTAAAPPALAGIVHRDISRPMSGHQQVGREACSTSASRRAAPPPRSRSRRP